MEISTPAKQHSQLHLSPSKLTSTANGVLNELLPRNRQDQDPESPAKSMELRRPPYLSGVDKSLHRKGLSAISLKQLARRDNNDKETKPKKSKSSTNLANLLSRNKGPKASVDQPAEETRTAKNKENRTPLEQYALPPPPPPPPIYAQFARQCFTNQQSEQDAQACTPNTFIPSKQSQQPQQEKRQGCLDLLPEEQTSLGESNSGTPKAGIPPTIWLPGGLNIIDAGKQRISKDLRNVSEVDSHRGAAEARGRKSSSDTRPSMERKPSPSKMDFTFAQRSARAFNSVWSHRKETGVVALEVEKPKLFSIDPKDVDTELEAMLDRRNIPENSRHKMRSLATDMKIELIKQDWAEIAAAKSNASVSTNSSRPGTRSGDDDSTEVEEIPGKGKKKARPLSLNFAITKGKKDLAPSPKKNKLDSSFGRHKRTKSADSTISARSFGSAGSGGVASSLIAKAKGQLPDDFVAYLRKVQKPEQVEVGKLHKLRLLLRNEMVAWTDNFITSGGMAEIVALLRRIMAVEWREEHEDNLLHESLLCLKALCTTALAQKHLEDIQSTLFPEFLAMIFDEERKGPAEFTTRNIIFDLLFTYLKSAPLEERSQRARTLLSYLRDPQKQEDERPVGFVLEMRRDRPYKVWCKEVVNVTKEVFWIFLHNLNVIALPSATDLSTAEATLHAAAFAATMASPDLGTAGTIIHDYRYMLTHFPTEPPPVAAAPYVGGVEWDATNYLACHLDLLNGIIACLPSAAERNALREHLKLSGWEKCMGGTMRTCKEKFYGGVHCGLRCWVAAARADGWDTKDTRQGPSPEVSLAAADRAPAPLLDMPNLNFGEGKEGGRELDGWL